MESAENPALSQSIAAALEWWRDAGVDLDYQNAPRDWLAAPEAEPTPAASRSPIAAPRPVAPEPEEPGLAPAAEWPRDPDAFRAWWLAEPSLDDGRLSGRVAARGPAGARTMVLVPEPEREDTDRLLSGPQGQLLDAILQTMDIPPGEAYIASVLPRHMPMPDWDALRRKGFARLTAHHIALADPERLLVFDGNILSLVGNDPPNTPETLRRFNHEGKSIPLFAARGLAALLERPRWKAGLWQSWLDWTATVTPGG